MAVQRLNLTRDQLGTFLKNFEQIKQFEALFALADQIAPSPDTPGVEIIAGTGIAAANEALAQIVALAQESGVNSGILEAKTQEAIDAVARINQTLELLALAPVRNNIELEHDVNGILPYANQTPSVRSNQVLTWLSM
jgi:hypothetical protein